MFSGAESIEYLSNLKQRSKKRQPINYDDMISEGELINSVNQEKLNKNLKES